MLLSWKEGRDFYLFFLFLIGLALLEGGLMFLGERRRAREAEAPPAAAAPSDSAAVGGSSPSGLEVTSVLAPSPDDSLFARVVGPRPFRFPEDHGPHPDFRAEWWYVTANLSTEDGRDFGVHFTLFRSAIAPGDPGGATGAAAGTDAPSGSPLSGSPASPPTGSPASPWTTRQLYLGHVALSDVEQGQHLELERFGRGAAGIAGAQSDPFRVWLEGWELAAEGATSEGPDGIFPLRLRGGGEEFDIDLLLEAGKGIVLQGDRGYSRKGADPSNASHYYSFPRMPAAGTIRTGDGAHQVRGLAWLDREWSTSALDAGQVGWDWFALQLEDGTELMLYQLRREDGTPDDLSSGVLIAADASTRSLRPSGWSLEVLDEWASPVDGAEWPSGWRIRIPSEALDLRIQPRFPDQEMRVTIRYWEGAVAVTGTRGGVPLNGRGYVELTGYGDSGRPGAAPR